MFTTYINYNIIKNNFIYIYIYKPRAASFFFAFAFGVSSMSNVSSGNESGNI